MRRESWLVPADTLRHLLASRDIVTATVALHRFVYERLAPCDLWFFRLLSPTAHARKPRLLDVASPLSVMVLRHALADRAADVYGHLIRARAQGWHCLIRACQV